ncbi:MAG TPA: type IV pili twitching motility protein PilT [Clostridiales bacterium]|nr:type IV pili twitching motility protein PilT [Clostridiales bacterium]
MYNADELFSKAFELKASDIHITVAQPPIMRIHGELQHAGNELLTPEDTRMIAYHLMSPKQREIFENRGELDFSYALAGIGRYRVNVYRQRKSVSVAARLINDKIPNFDMLGLQGELFSQLAMRPRGLILVTGPTGSGKSTTLAAMVNHINTNRNCHILTLEDPIEYLFRHKKSMINQREVGDDTQSFANGLRAALREDPDVILVGEMRDLETIGIAISASETGHLVLSTLHTTGAVETINRVIDVFPPHQQQQIRIQLASTLQAVISQQLLPKADGSGRVVAIETMVVNDAVKNNIREGKTHLVHNIIQTGQRQGMISMDMSLARLIREGTITMEEGTSRAVDIAMLRQYLAY